jgi:mono/diheme cytochrome c family protein
MSIFLIKTLLSIPLILLVLFGIFTMFEIHGRPERKYDIEKMKRLHKTGGYLYLALFLIISTACIIYVVNTKVELTARGTFHSVIAMTIFVLLCIKISIARVYRQFYQQAKTIGLTIAVLSLVMSGISSGYYMVATGGTPKKELSAPSQENQEQRNPAPVRAAISKWRIKTDNESISRGKELYDQKCASCHDPYSNKVIIGPGHKGILKKTHLPSGRPATAENIANQIRNPIGKMPSYAYLTDDQILDIIAYMNTL